MATLAITNPDGSAGLTGWTLDPVSTPGTYAVDSGAAGLVASPNGTTTSFFSNGANFVQMYQIIPLTSLQITQVQSGRSYVDVSFVAGTYTDYNKAGLTITPMDAANTELHTLSTGDTKNQSARSAISGVWTPRGLRSYLPPSTTQVKIAIFSKPYYTFTNDGYITDIIVNLLEDAIGQEMLAPAGIANWRNSSGILSPDNVTLYPNVIGSPADNYSDPWDCGMHRGGLFFPPAALATPITASQGLKISINYDNLFNAIPTNYDPNYLSIDIDCYDSVGNYLGTTVTEEELMTPYGPAVTANRLLQTPTGAVKGIIRVTGHVRAYGEFGFRFNSFAISVYNIPGVDANSYQFADKLMAKTYVKSFPVQANPNSVFDALNFENTVFQSWNPTFVSSTAFTSCELKSFTRDYFGLVYIMPLEHNYGDIQNDTTFTYTLWNAFLYAPASLQSMNFDTANGGQSQVANGGGVTFPAYSLPITLGAQQYTSLDVTALAVGPPTVTAKLDLTSSVATIDEPGAALNLVDVKSIALKGNRGKVLPYTHNWKNDYTIDYSYKTEIVKAWSGREQRRATRSVPRRVVHIEGLVSPDGQNFIEEFGQNSIIVPECVDYANFTLNPDGTLSTTEFKGWMTAGAIIFMGKGCCDAQLISTSLVSAVTTLGVTTMTVGSVPPADGRMYLGVIGRTDSANSAFLTSNLATNSISVNETPGSYHYPPKALPLAVVNGEQQNTGVMYGTYEAKLIDGLEIFDLEPDWGSSVKVDYKPNRHDLDFSKGIVNFNIPERPTIIYKMTYIEKSAEYITDFFKRHKGRRSSFYFTTHIRDMEATPGGIGLDKVILAKAPDFNQLGQPYGISIKKAGQWHHFKIKSITGVEIIVNSAFTVDMTAPEKVSWLYKARLETDKLSLNYKTTEMVEFNLATRIL